MKWKLAVIAPEPATHYHVLDLDEFAGVIRKGQMSVKLAAHAIECLHALINEVHAGQFPPVEVRQAEDFAAEWVQVKPT